MRRFRVAGLFESGMYEFDRGLALVNLADAALLFRSGAGVTGLRLAFVDPLRAPALVRDRGALPRRPRLLRQRLDRGPCQLLPLDRDHQIDDVPHPADDRRGRRLQHRRDAGHDREGEADRHRDPAHPRGRPAQRAAHLRDPGRAHRPGRHAAAAPPWARCWRTTCSAWSRASSTCSARSFSMRGSTT